MFRVASLVDTRTETHFYTLVSLDTLAPTHAHQIPLGVEPSSTDPRNKTSRRQGAPSTLIPTPTKIDRRPQSANNILPDNMW